MSASRAQNHQTVSQPFEQRKRILARLIGLLIVVAFLGASAAWIAGSMLIGSSHQNVGDLPPDLNGQPVEIPSSSGEMLRGWLVSPAKFGGFDVKAAGPRGVVLMHGLRANRVTMLDRTRFLTAAGYSVLLFDFQAHGESTGDTITFGYIESKDARAAVDFMKLKYPNGPVGVVGVSMGGAAALLASPKLDVDAMVLEEVYPDIKTAIADRFQMALGGWARILTPLLSLQMKPRLGVSADQMRPIDRMSQIQVPKLIIAGSEDRHTTIEESRALFDAAAEPKQFWVVQGASHTDMCSFAPAEYRDRILAFFAANLSRRSR